MAGSSSSTVNRLGAALGVIAVAAVSAVAAWQQVQARDKAYSAAASLTGGSADIGKQTIQTAGCNACHTIPGVYPATATVGPSLEKFAVRSYVAGSLPNQPDNLVCWLLDPPSIHPGTAMPRTNLDEQQARDIAAYLYTLK